MGEEGGGLGGVGCSCCSGMFKLVSPTIGPQYSYCAKAQILTLGFAASQPVPPRAGIPFEKGCSDTHYTCLESKAREWHSARQSCPP